jgi:chaperonin GroEL (HSP60 family)
MMVDRFGDVVISNDGVTILKLMEVTHPVARMIINTARAQQEEVGDGTTTATILAGALVAEGANQVMRGVPVTQVIKGIDIGIKESMALMKKYSRPVHTVEDPVLFEVACIAGRGDRELARLVLDGARIVGWERLQEKDYRLADAIAARAGAENRLFMGLLLNKEPVNQEMPRTLQQVSILVIDDALGPEEIDDGARSTEAGFQYYLQARERYEKSLQNICGLGVNLVLVDRSIDDTAEQIFTEAGIMVLQRVSQRDLEKVCKHTGARKIKRSALNRAPENLRAYLGKADRAEVDDRLKHTCIINGKGEKWATVIIGAATEEVVDERERIARDAAASVQAAARQGVIPEEEPWKYVWPDTWKNWPRS